MTIERALGRFETVMSAAWPSAFAALRPGLDDGGIARLRRAVAPYLVPAQVEALYRWRNGGDSGVFGGWRMRGLDELVDAYRFGCDSLGSPPTWLPVFDDHIVNVVTLDLPGLPVSDPSVWYGHTHDLGLHRLFDSIAALLEVVCDAAGSGLAVDGSGRVGLEHGELVVALDDDDWTPLRLARCPGAWRWPDPPPGSDLEQLPDVGWPREWLLPLDVTDASLTLRGATHSIAQIVAEAAQGETRGTVRGRVVTGAGSDGWWFPVVGDETGRIVVACHTRRHPVVVPHGAEGEFDVVLTSDGTPGPDLGEDPEVAAVLALLRPTVPVAVAVGVRPL